MYKDEKPGMWDFEAEIFRFNFYFRLSPATKETLHMGWSFSSIGTSGGRDHQEGPVSLKLVSA